MSEHDAIVRSLRPASKRLYDATVRLATCLQCHQEARAAPTQDGGSEASGTTCTGDSPTLAALARHYRLGQLLRTIAPLIAVQEKLFRRLEKRPNNLAKQTFPELFETMDRESRAILKIANDFSVEKEDRHEMESNINHIRESLQAITDAFERVEASQYASPGRLDNRMADIVDDLRLDWTALRSIREGFPVAYPINYGRLQGKS